MLRLLIWVGVSLLMLIVKEVVFKESNSICQERLLMKRESLLRMKLIFGVLVLFYTNYVLIRLHSIHKQKLWYLKILRDLM